MKGVNSMFVDRVKIRIEAGSGGNGMIAFHREKFIDKGFDKCQNT